MHREAGALLERGAARHQYVELGLDLLSGVEVLAWSSGGGGWYLSVSPRLEQRRALTRWSPQWRVAGRRMRRVGFACARRGPSLDPRTRLEEMHSSGCEASERWPAARMRVALPPRARAPRHSRMIAKRFLSSSLVTSLPVSRSPSMTCFSSLARAKFSPATAARFCFSSSPTALPVGPSTRRRAAVSATSLHGDRVSDTAEKRVYQHLILSLP